MLLKRNMGWIHNNIWGNKMPNPFDQFDAQKSSNPFDQFDAPQIPDMSGVQKMAQDNLAANDNKPKPEESSAPSAPQTPAQILDTAIGTPINSLLNEKDKTQPSAAIRGNYVDALKNGSASDSSDFWQSALHSIVSIASDIGKVAASEAAKGAEYLATSSPFSIASDIAQNTVNLPVQGATRLAGEAYEKLGGELSPAAAKVLTQGVPEFGQSDAKKAVRGALNTATGYEPETTPGKVTQGAFEIAPYIVGGEGSIARKAIGIAAGSGGSEAGSEAAKALGFGERGQQVGSVIGGAPGLIFGAGSGGIWDNHPGSDAVKEAIAKKAGKDPSAVSSQDIDQTIATGTKDKMPAGKDFQDVATVMGHDSPDTLHEIYRETGIRPEQVFSDAQHDPQVASDVSEGKIPEAYQKFIEPKIEQKAEVEPEAKEPEGLQVTVADDKRGFNIVDKDGDHVAGGFDSAEDARQFIEDKKHSKIGDEPPEWTGKEEKPSEIDKSDPFYKYQSKLGRSDEEISAMQQERLPTEQTAAGEQTVIPGAEKISDRELAERKMQGGKQAKVAQKPADEGLFDTGARKQTDLLDAIKEVKTKEAKPNVIPPSEKGKPTSLSSFLRNNGAKFDQNGEMTSIRTCDENGKLRTMQGDDGLDVASELAQQAGYFRDRPLTNELQNTLRDTNGGREHFRAQDADRLLKQHENELAKQQNDPAYIEHEAALAGIDTDKVEGETDRQHTNRLLRELEKLYKNQEGSAATNLYRRALGATILAAEKFAGKLGGGLFEKLADGYIKTFQPELVGDKAKRADAYMAKFKTSLQEAENAYYRQSAINKRMWDKASTDERMKWLYDHETGRWNEKDNPDHARYQALYDAMHKAEKNAIGGDADKAYKDNYLPHQWEDAEAVKNYFRSEAMIKKYGSDWFNKASTFKLIQEGVRAGFKLKTDNPESMLVARQLASHNMIATMDLLHDMESNGLAKTARTFSVDKRIAKTEEAIKEAQKKYDKASTKINDPNQPHWDFTDPAVSRYMANIENSIDTLNKRMADLNKEKSDNKLTADQMKELRNNGFKVIGPDSKVWSIHQEVAPLWKNAMEMKGLWENQGVLGDAYRGYTAAKALWTQAKLGLSLFHPFHEAIINLASGIAASADHLIQGGSVSKLALGDIPKIAGKTLGITGETLKGRDHPAIQAWNTAPEARTPEQQKMVQTMVEGGFKPTMSARDTVHFRENFDKAINGIGLNNLRLIGTAIQLPGLVMKPFFEHWIPGMKSEIYLRRCDDALSRDPSLANDAGKRGEAFRKIGQDTDRTYGEMNNDVQFWNKTVRDSFNAAFISGGWKLAQIYNARGLLQPAKIAYNFAKTGEFSKEDITYNMLHAYTYTALTLATGAAVNAALGNPIAKAKDDIWAIVKNLVAPQTGEKNPDGTPIRLNQPAFAKEAYNLAHEINTKGLVAGSGSFLYHQTLLPGIVDTLSNRDFTGRELISDPTDLHQWANAGWDFINPIAASTYQKAEAKHSEIGKYAAFAGFPMAGAYLNQTPFEQKVLYTYDEQNPPKSDVYSAKLKSELKSAMASGDSKKVENVREMMKKEGMSDHEISQAAHVFTTPFVDSAWKKLSSENQKHLIESASPEEKKRFTLKSN